MSQQPGHRSLNTSERRFTSRDYKIESFQGSGSGKKWVTSQYPRFVKELRRRNYQTSLVLVVITDADELSVQRRKQDLDQALSDDGQDVRGSADQIVLWIPRWHIETWYLHFNGFKVAEDEKCKADFSKHVGNDERKKCHVTFVDEYRQFKTKPDAVTETSLSSLVSTHEESLAIPF